MKAIGVRGSDIHVYHGKHPYAGYPVAQGREVSAVVAELGTGVANFAVGDHAIRRYGDVKGKKVLVVGGGSISPWRPGLSARGRPGGAVPRDSRDRCRRR